jgi:hypothetical protein
MRPQTGYINKDQATVLVEKWSPVLDYSSNSVAPIEDDHTRLNTAILLENQERWCFEAAGDANIAGGSGSVYGSAPAAYGGPGGTGGNVGNVDSYATGDARLPKVLIPMIRRTFPELITNEIVGVQPMSGPVGLAFALRYRYEGGNLGDSYGGNANDSSNGGTLRPQSQPADGSEVGYQDLDTRFTGACSLSLSGLTPGGLWDQDDQDTGVADLLSSFELTSNIPQMVLEFEKTAVEAGTRRLAAKWSIELEQDIKNMNGIDIDNELTNAMSYEIQAEIDREMIMRMVQVALNAGGGTRDGRGYSIWNAASADARWLGERTRDFYAKVIVEANRIAVRNRRGAANFIVATPRVCAMLEMLPEFKFMPVNGNVNTQPVGIAKVGSVGGRFNIYRDTRTEAQYQTARRSTPLEYALLGYKGSEYYDTGIVYAPYIPVMIQRTIGPNDFAPRVGLLTRYGVVDNLFGAELYYHVIIVTGLGEAFIPGGAHTYL